MNYSQEALDAQSDVLWTQEDETLEESYGQYEKLCEIAGEPAMSFADWKSMKAVTEPAPVNQPSREELEQMLEELRQENEELIAELETVTADRNLWKELQQNTASQLYSSLDKRDPGEAYEALARRLYDKLLRQTSSNGVVAWDKWDTQTRIYAVENEVHNLQDDLKWYSEEWKKIPERKTPANQPLFPHYFIPVPENTTHMDVYFFLKAWGVTDPCIQHSVKKLLAAGRRGAKDVKKDLSEAKDSIVRAIELL